MSARLDRARQLARTAKQREDVAAAELRQAAQEVREAEAACADAATSTAEAADAAGNPAFRAAVLVAGARTRERLTTERDHRRCMVADRRDAWDQARVRTKSMEKLVERAERDLAARRLAAERAELNDVIAGRTAKERLEHRRASTATSTVATARSTHRGGIQ